MNFIEKLIPSGIKTNIKFLLYKLLKIPFSKSVLPLSILSNLDKNNAINFLDIGENVGRFSESLFPEYLINKHIIIEPLANHTEAVNKKFNNSEYKNSSGKLLQENASFINSLYESSI